MSEFTSFASRILQTFVAMRQGPYELLVLDSNDVPYEERMLIDKPCIRAEPGKEYHVRINVYRNALGHFPAKYLRFGLYIDGVDVQYWKRIDLSDEALLPEDPAAPVTSCFWGFKKNVNDIRSFIFSVPDTTPHQTALSQKEYKCLGSVKLEVYEACITYGTYENQSGQFEAPSTQQIGENEKFWKQASLTTAAGRRIELEKEKFRPLPRWKNLRKTPDEVLVLQYHTAAMMDFLEENHHKLKETTNIGARQGSERKVVYDLTSDGEDGGEQEARVSNLGTGGGGSNTGSAENSVGKRTHPSDTNSNTTAVDANPSSPKRHQVSSVGNDSDIPLSTTQGGDNNATDKPTTPSEIPIDEEISYVVHKKIVPFLDLSDESVEEGINVTWSTLTS